MREPKVDQPKPAGPPAGLECPSTGEARALIESQGLRFEPEFDELAGLYEHGELVASGARAGYVLKMLAIAPSHQGTDTLAALVTGLVQSALAAGHETLFVFTRPQNVASFEALNFRLLVTDGTAALLECGPGLEAYLAAHAAGVPPGPNGAIVLNGNPFTLGHQHLAGLAAREVERLFVFVVSEERSAFHFEARLRMAREGTAHLANVTVLETSRYSVSAGTFPSYFLKRLDEASRAQMQIDLRLFAERLAPRFHIATRFVGREPLCPTTSAYNEAMGGILDAHGIRLVVAPRLEALGGPVSATRVREAFAQDRFDELEALVPATTLHYLRSPEARPIAERLRAQKKGA